MRDRFNERFPTVPDMAVRAGDQSLNDDIVAFIEEEITLAVQKREEELREEIESMPVRYVEQLDGEDMVVISKKRILSLLPVPSEVTK